MATGAEAADDGRRPDGSGRRLQQARRSPEALASKVPAWIGFAAAGATVCAGLWVSLHYCLVAWKADPDMFVTVALWRGVREHGLGFLRTWTYTQDNWLLSLLPISSLFYATVGATPRVAALTGWTFFVASVGLTAWLTARLVAWRAAVIVACVLLFANYHTLGHIGFLGYPISHNVSMAWGLVVLLLSASGIERRATGRALQRGRFSSSTPCPTRGPAPRSGSRW